MNKTILFTAGALVAGTLIGTGAGLYAGYDAPETVVKCDVNDQKFAEHNRAIKLGEEVEKLIDAKMRLKSEISTYELKRKTLIGELGLLETQVVDTKVFIEEARDALEASKKTSAFAERTKRY